MSNARTRDIFTSVLFLLAGSFTLFVLIPEGVPVPGSVEKQALSPDFWPRIVTIGAIGAALFLLFESCFLTQPAGLSEEDTAAAHNYEMPFLPGAVKTLVLILGLFAFYAGLSTFGLVVLSIILLCAMMVLFGERHLPLIAGLSLGTPILLYIFFRYVASVPIPLGIFGS